MHTSIAAVRSSPTHWNVNGSIANTSKLVVSIATNSPGRSATSDPNVSLGAVCALRRLFAGKGTDPSTSTSSTIRLNVCRRTAAPAARRSPAPAGSRPGRGTASCAHPTRSPTPGLGDDRFPQPLIDPGAGHRPRGAPSTSPTRPRRCNIPAAPAKQSPPSSPAPPLSPRDGHRASCGRDRTPPAVPPARAGPDPQSDNRTTPRSDAPTTPPRHAAAQR